MFEDIDGTLTCIEECPSGYFPATVDSIDTCSLCHPACAECLANTDSDSSAATYDPDVYEECCGDQCADGFYKLDAGINKIKCLRSCPEGYYPIVDERRCVEKWRIIAFQDTVIDNLNYTEKATVRGALSDPLVNFWDFDQLANFEDTNGLWKFKFEWQLENSMLAELVWTQDYNPLTTAADPKPTTPVIDILSVTWISCSYGINSFVLSIAISSDSYKNLLFIGLCKVKFFGQKNVIFQRF